MSGLEVGQYFVKIHAQGQRRVCHHLCSPECPSHVCHNPRPVLSAAQSTGHDFNAHFTLQYLYSTGVSDIFALLDSVWSSVKLELYRLRKMVDLILRCYLSCLNCKIK